MPHLMYRMAVQAHSHAPDPSPALSSASVLLIDPSQVPLAQRHQRPALPAPHHAAPAPPAPLAVLLRVLLAVAPSVLVYCPLPPAPTIAPRAVMYHNLYCAPAATAWPATGEAGPPVRGAWVALVTVVPLRCLPQVQSTASPRLSGRERWVAAHDEALQCRHRNVFVIEDRVVIAVSAPLSIAGTWSSF